MHSSVDEHLCDFQFLAIRNNAASIHLWMYVYIPSSGIVGLYDNSRSYDKVQGKEQWLCFAGAAVKR